MHYRRFGSTDLMLSEVGFGSWAIGGTSFGAVSKPEALAALAKAEDLGCNFIDTAGVYGNAEEIIGAFLKQRRSKWQIASKYSGQQEGMRATIEKQLTTLGIDALDLYQIHWMPSHDQEHLLEELATLKAEGKTRYIGVSLYNEKDIARALNDPRIDGFQLKISLLAPSPFLENRDKIRHAGKGLLARSSLEDGFLTGKYDANATFANSGDKRSELSTAQVRQLTQRAQAFQGLCTDQIKLLLLATRYVLAFPEVSSLLLSTKNPQQAETNFGLVPSGALANSKLDEIEGVQRTLQVFDHPSLARKVLRKLLRLVGQS